MADTTPHHWIELRIHGVSGTPPESMLDSAHVQQVAGDAWGRFFRPVDGVGGPLQDQADRTLEGYHWGKYTSGSWLQGLWLILIPFGLVNAAAFMVPDLGTAPRWLRVTVQALIRALGVGVTATFALASSLITIDLLAGKWAPTVGWLGPLPSGWVMAVSVVLAGAVLVGLFWLGNQNRTSAFDKTPPGSLAEKTGGRGLGNTSFFTVDPDSSPVLGRLHISVGWSVVALVGALAWQTIGDHTDSEGISHVQHVVWWLSIGLVVALAGIVLVLGDPQRAASGSSTHTRWEEHILPVVAAVSLGLSGGVLLCSAALLVPTDHQTFDLDVDAYSQWLATAAGVTMLVLAAATAALAWRTRTPESTPRPFRRYAHGMAPWAASSVGVFLGVGFCAAFVLGMSHAVGADAQTELLYRVAYSWGLTLGLLLVQGTIVLAFCWPTKKRRSPVTASFAAVTEGPRGPDLSPGWLRQVAKARRMAALKLYVGCVFITFAVAGWLMTAVAAIEMLGESQTWMRGPAGSLGWLQYLSEAKPAPGARPWVTVTTNVGTYALIALAGGLFVLGRTAVRGEERRRGLNVVWDVVSFWPHSAHPFVPPAYSQFAVHDLRRRIRFHLGLPPSPPPNGPDPEPDDTSPRIVISAHSQGSLIVLATLLWLRPCELRRIGWVTYGSQLQVAYPRGFPAYVDYHRLTQVQDALDGRWVNLFRETDPIAGPVLSWDREPDAHATAASRRLGGGGLVVDSYDHGTGRRESGRDWRVLDPPPIDPDLQVSTRVHLSRHSGYPGSLDYPDAVTGVRPT